MSHPEASERRVVMARRVAGRFLESHLQPEYRMKVYSKEFGAVREKRSVPNLLRSFRDGKLRIGSVQPIPDLGIQENFDHFMVWSSDHDSIVNLKDWFENHGYETSGVW